MGPEWLQAYSAMLPKLIAQQQLAWLEVILVPNMKEKDAKKTIRALRSRAIGGSGEYNEKGQLELHDAAQVKAWFGQFGHNV